MKKAGIKVLSAMLILLTLIQIALNSRLIKKREDLQCEVQLQENKSIKYKDLSTLNNELSCLKMCQLISATNDKTKWKVKVKLTGNRNDILNQMVNLQKYEITSYYIKKNSEESYVVLEMYGI